MRSSLPALLVPVLVLISACGGSGADRLSPRLVVLYATCTMNRSYLGAYDDSVTTTPNLDAFAENGVVFRRHQSESGQSGISFASIFSGTQAYAHGVYTHPNRLPDDLYLITEAFQAAGYEPFFWSGHPMAAYELNYAQGVPPENVYDPQDASRGGKLGRRARKLAFLQKDDEIFQGVMKRLEEDPDYKAFLLVSFTVTHGLYHRQVPTPVYREFVKNRPDAAEGLTMADLEAAWEVYTEHRFDLQWDFPGALRTIDPTPEQLDALVKALRVTYRADVAWLDNMFGATMRRIEEAGLLDDSLIAFTADHGETLYREGTLFKWTHGLQLAPEVLEVPLVIRAQGIAPGDYDQVTRSIDVFPTLAGLCGIDLVGRGVQGDDLSAEILGEEPREERLAYSHTTTIGPLHEEDFRSWELASRFWGSTDPELIWVRVRDGDRVWKWRNLDGTTWGPQAFDLAADPWEERDLFDPDDPEDAAMLQRLKAYKGLLVERFGETTSDLPEDAEARLQDLGYIE
jgi:arylsulfatase A-like enzyme